MNKNKYNDLAIGESVTVTVRGRNYRREAVVTATLSDKIGRGGGPVWIRFKDNSEEYRISHRFLSIDKDEILNTTKKQRYKIVTTNITRNISQWDEPTFVYVGDGDLDAAKLEFDQEMGMFLVEEAITRSKSTRKDIVVMKERYEYLLINFDFLRTKVELVDIETYKVVSRG